MSNSRPSYAGGQQAPWPDTLAPAHHELHSLSHDFQFGEALRSAVLPTLACMPGAGFAVLDQRNVFLLISEAEARFFTGRSAAELTGLTVEDGIDPGLGEETRAITRRLRASGGVGRARGVWGGRQFVCRWARLRSTQLTAQVYLVMTQTTSGWDAAGPEDFRHHYVHLGPRLSRLSPRELEVLSLFAKGFRRQEIADLIDRSTKTVDKHREALLAKLRVGEVSEAVRLAIAAGLDLNDVERVNIAHSTRLRPEPLAM